MFLPAMRHTEKCLGLIYNINSLYIHLEATLLGITVLSNAFQYNSSAVTFIFTNLTSVVSVQNVAD